MDYPDDLNHLIREFTPRARHVLELAQEEAIRFNHDYVGTEHLLLGLLALNEGVAVSVLKGMDLNLDKLRLEVERSFGGQGSTSLDGARPLSTRLVNVLQRALEEARKMKFSFVAESTKKNLEMRVDAENGATQGKFDLAKQAKELNLDAIHDTVHEMARDEARHGKAFEGLLKRYFGK